MTRDVGFGECFPLGASVAGDGVNFALYSKNASQVELLFFDSVDSGRPSRVMALDRQRHRTYHYWHVFVPRTLPGQLYGYLRVAMRIAGDDSALHRPAAILGCLDCSRNTSKRRNRGLSNMGLCCDRFNQ